MCRSAGTSCAMSAPGNSGAGSSGPTGWRGPRGEGGGRRGGEGGVGGRGGGGRGGARGGRGGGGGGGGGGDRPADRDHERRQPARAGPAQQQRQHGDRALVRQLVQRGNDQGQEPGGQQRDDEQGPHCRILPSVACELALVSVLTPPPFPGGSRGSPRRAAWGRSYRRSPPPSLLRSIA